MNAWLACASVLLVAGLFPVVWGVSTGPLGRGVVAQNFGTSVVCLVMLLLAQGYGRPAYTDLALVLAVLGPVGTLVYTRLLADELGEAPPEAQLPTVLAAAATVPVVIASCVAAGPGRAAVKLVMVGVLLVAGNVISSRTLSGAHLEPGEARRD
ncbi:monovalent cation/H+ antiporter complex subunit F [Streptomyces sp. NBC_01318]|uniref:monovalent cation/H+ antiporter complex subunit F n=1 Tax=Streptomyces sp. NBC_01318 TaxID=2903823 RepID=UPI002E0D2ECD|nr:monovalent cation/H+ antiporter complex subunit F [Streptomyces sp. NBC_01318]